MFAELRPKMTRYTSVDDITTALVELEEKERLAKSAANGLEENGTDDAKIVMGDSDSYSDRSSIKEADELLSEGNDEGSESINGDDEDEDAGPSRSEEDEVAIRKKKAEVDPAEMEDFDREFKAMMQVKSYYPSFLTQSRDIIDPHPCTMLGIGFYSGSG
jgi:regulator of nonsense transcripts 2